MTSTPEQQLSLGSSIKEISTNVHRGGIDRKTSVFLAKALADTKDLWAQFQEGHKTLSIESTHSYLSQNVFGTVEGMVTTLIKELTETIAAKKPEASGIEAELGDEIEMLRFVCQGILSDPATSKTESLCKRLVSQLDLKWARIQNLVLQIKMVNPEFRLVGSLQLEKGYTEALVIVENGIGREPKAEVGITGHGVRANTFLPKLPEIQITKFDGNYALWRQFKNLFKSLIHNNEFYSNTHKLAYLKSYVAGEAFKLIQHLQVADENYESAWSLLCERYDNPRLQVSAIVDKLLKIKNIETQSASALKHLHDTAMESVFALENIGISVEHWDPLLHLLLLRKLDVSTHSMYEQQLEKPRELQDFKSLLKFVERKFQALEVIGSSKTERVSKNEKHAFINLEGKDHEKITEKCCVMCNRVGHDILSCFIFKKLSEKERYEKVKSLKLCIACLVRGHSYRFCKARCQKCDKKHNTLVHFETSVSNKSDNRSDNKSDNRGDKKSDNKNDDKGVSGLSLTAAIREPSTKDGYVFLATALVNVLDRNGRKIKCRALLDNGSQLNLITEGLRKRLGISFKNSDIELSGIGGNKTEVHKRAKLVILSNQGEYSANLEAFVLPKITGNMPSRSVSITNWKVPENLSLADPSFNQPAAIDMLIGAELYVNLLKEGSISFGEELPSLQNTVFGWIIIGKLSGEQENGGFCGVATLGEQCLNRKLEQFWKIERIEDDEERETVAEGRIQKFFSETTKRGYDGKFIVKLPFIGNPESIGNTLEMARSRFGALERRLLKFPDMYAMYSDFLREYLDMGHMEPVELDKIKGPYNFLPHHSVLRPESTTTKLRVVFDASAKGKNNVSLNDVLAVGPKIQQDLFDILVRFRMHQYAITADIEKMYRQVWLDTDDQNMQLIVWRLNPTDKRESYFRLKTITYGTTSASYLATKCLKVLAAEGRETFPLAAEAAGRDFYMDDIITGCDDLQCAIQLQKELQNLLLSGGFNLRKWCSNSGEVLSNVPRESCEFDFHQDQEDRNCVKTLGITWLPALDEFNFKASWIGDKIITKRNVISETAQLFDPLGLASPVIVTAKIFMQELWKQGFDWDDELPLNLQDQWRTYRLELFKLNRIMIKRYVSQPIGSKQIHAFSDASEKAYGAAVYIRSDDGNGGIKCKLLCAKSRVAPLKVLTLPRLELAAAKLMVDLVKRVQAAIGLSPEQSYYWTDSRITLAWIQAESSSLKTFVANRVSTIQRSSIVANWRHIKGDDNPADLVSRGCFAGGLNDLWFNGPLFLKESGAKWESAKTEEFEDTSNERRSRCLLVAAEDENHFLKTIRHGNSFSRLRRIVAWVLRFIGGRSGNHFSELTVKEINDSQNVILRYVQASYFSDEINRLKGGGQVANQSNIGNLSPVLDADGLLRVGGRLEASSLSYGAKHQIILPHQHEFAKLLIVQYHIDNLHAGPQALLAAIRQKFWITNGKSATRTAVSHCVLCARARPKLLGQIMGNLPKERVTPARPFENTGVDFCGPIQIHYKLRGKRPTKAYIAVFVCFAVKAVHLEVVSDLTTDAFLAALKRFIGRRGLPAKIFSDNATNFVGANNRLSELKELFGSEEHRSKVDRYCVHQGIQWKFIPARSPHFGGLWEAAVKSLKHHLTRTLHNATLTFEELSTLVVEVEAILNSRPLTQMSDSVLDLQPLTAGHFLIGQPLTSITENQSEKVKISGGKRWDALRALKAEFWRRWSKEYLCELNLRNKWKNSVKDVPEGTMVIMRDENVPPLEWRMARVIKTCPGEDGRTRVVELRTSTGITRRAVHRVCPLPTGDEKIEVIEKRSAPVDEGIGPTQPPTKKRVVLPVGETWRESNTKASAVPRLFTFLVTCLVLFQPSSSTQNFSVTKFETNPGMYFENIARGDLITSEWKLLVYFDLNNYWMEYDGFRRIINKLNQLCEKSDQMAYCNEVLNQFRYDLVNIQEINGLIFSRKNYTLGRKRRGLFNFVGTMERFFYGTLDQNYANEMADTIDKIKQNEDFLHKLIKNQSTLVDSTINIVKRQENDVRRQFEEIIREINTIKQMGQKLQLNGRFSTLAVHTSLILASYRRMQQAIFDVVTKSHHDTISTLILTPKQLLKEVSRMNSELPTKLKIPGIDEKMDTLRLYRIMSVTSQITDKLLIFGVKIPLILDKSFRVFHVIPVPLLIGDEFVKIIYNNKYLMVDEHFEQYYPMGELEIHGCKEFEEDHILCMPKHPMVSRQAHRDDCGFGLLIGQYGTIPKNCHFHTSKQLSSWIRLKDPNSWIYSFASAQVLDITCRGKMANLALNGSGLIELSRGCAIHHNHITISAYGLKETEVSAAVVPNWSLSTYENITRIHEMHHLSVSVGNHTNQLDALKKQLKDIREQTLPNEVLQNYSQQKDVVIHFGVIYIILVIGLAVAVYLLWRRYCLTNGVSSNGAITNNFELQLSEFKAREHV